MKYELSFNNNKRVKNLTQFRNNFYKEFFKIPCASTKTGKLVKCEFIPQFMIYLVRL